MPCPSRSRAHFFAVSHSGEAPSGIGCRRRHSACSGEKTQGDVISNPGRRLALCVAPYFADRGVGDMRGRVKVAPKSHPGGGARLSAVAVDALAVSVAALLCSAVGARLLRCLCSAMPISPIRPIGPIPAILPPPGCVNFRLTRRFWRDLRAHHIRPPYLCCRDAPRGQGRMPGSRCIYNTVIG